MEEQIGRRLGFERDVPEFVDDQEWVAAEPRGPGHELCCPLIESGSPCRHRVLQRYVFQVRGRPASVGFVVNDE